MDGLRHRTLEPNWVLCRATRGCVLCCIRGPSGSDNVARRLHGTPAVPVRCRRVRLLDYVPAASTLELVCGESAVFFGRGAIEGIRGCRSGPNGTCWF